MAQLHFLVVAKGGCNVLTRPVGTPLIALIFEFDCSDHLIVPTAVECPASDICIEYTLLSSIWDGGALNAASYLFYLPVQLDAMRFLCRFVSCRDRQEQC